MSTAVLMVKVLPKTSREEIVGWEGDALKIRLKAPPEKGEANKALIAFLAKTLGVSKQSVTIISGDTSRRKRLSIAGLTQEALAEKLSHL